MDKSTILKRNEEIVSSEIDGETVMMDLDFENYFGMAAIGTRIWQILEEEITVEGLCEQLVNEYEVNAEQCLKDISPFLKKLATHKMIEVS